MTEPTCNVLFIFDGKISLSSSAPATVPYNWDNGGTTTIIVRIFDR